MEELRRCSSEATSHLRIHPAKKPHTDLHYCVNAVDGDSGVLEMNKAACKLQQICLFSQ